MLINADWLQYQISCDRDLRLPVMLPVEQTFASTRLDDVESVAGDSIAAIAASLPPLGGKKVALTAGSRGIKNIPGILKALVSSLEGMGAIPFIVPAMGSHGGATAEGQLAVLHEYGITEESTGAPIVSSMDTVAIGQLADGTEVYCDKSAFTTDYIIPVGRVKPHPDFKADIESGLCKMLAIGLGKHQGAKTLHHLGFDRMSRTIEETAGVFVNTGHVLCGVAIVENAHSQTMTIEAILPDDIIAREKILLAEAKQAMPRLYLSSIDILIVDMMGKEISGAGMDPNITGRPVTGQPGFSAPPIQNIAVLDLSEHSAGNAVGVGMADVITLRLAEKITLGSTYTNSITAAGLKGSKLPLIARDDLDAVLIAYCACHRVTPESVKVVHIKNTSSISRIEVSENMRAEVEAHSAMCIVGDAQRLHFVDSVLHSTFG